MPKNVVHGANMCKPSAFGTLRYPALLCSYASPRLPGPPGGAPAAATNSPKAQHVKDARGDGFRTTLQPAAKAGATLSTSGLGIGPVHINQLLGI